MEYPAKKRGQGVGQKGPIGSEDTALDSKTTGFSTNGLSLSLHSARRYDELSPAIHQEAGRSIKEDEHNAKSDDDSGDGLGGACLFAIPNACTENRGTKSFLCAGGFFTSGHLSAGIDP